MLIYFQGRNYSFLNARHGATSRERWARKGGQCVERRAKLGSSVNLCQEGQSDCSMESVVCSCPERIVKKPIFYHAFGAFGVR